MFCRTKYSDIFKWFNCTNVAIWDCCVCGNISLWLFPNSNDALCNQAWRLNLNSSIPAVPILSSRSNIPFLKLNLSSCSIRLQIQKSLSGLVLWSNQKAIHFYRSMERKTSVTKLGSTQIQGHVINLWWVELLVS